MIPFIKDMSDEGRLAKTFKAVKDNLLTIYKSAKLFDINRETLSNHLIILVTSKLFSDFFY